MKGRDYIMQLHLAIAERRGMDATYCPSEVARQFNLENWRDNMNIVREVADELIENGQLMLLQKGIPIKGKATDAIGPIRLGKMNNISK